MLSRWVLLGVAPIIAVGQSSGDGLALFGSCDGGNPIATIRSSDPVQIRYSFAGGTETCYAVSATANGKEVEGFLLGAAHPMIAEFEKEARSHIPAIPDPPKPKPEPSPDAKEAKKDEPPPMPTSFAGLRAVDYQGHSVNLAAMSAPTVVLYFWSAANRRSIKDSEALEQVYGTHHSKGVEVIGIAAASSAKRVQEICQENEFIWPQVLDSGKIASEHHVTPDKPYLILNRQRNVVAALSSAHEVDRVLKQLSAQPSRKAE